jgi:DNA-binding LacI/PurR family transcriptional regulator
MPLLRQPGALAPYQQIREILRKEILDRMAVGDRIPPERDLAERFSANRATVSRAIASLVSEGLLVRHVPRGTFVAGDWNLSPTRTRAVAMVVPEIEGPFPAGVVRSAAREFRKQGYNPFLFDSDNSVATETGELERLMQEGLEGALVIPVAPRDNLPVFERLVRLGYPLVFLDHKPLDFDADYVASDYFWGAYEATRILIERGHSRIAHFTYVGPGLHTSVLDRRHGYEKALADHGIDVDPDLVLAPIIRTHVGSPYEYRHVLYYLRRQDDPVTAVFALNDLFAISTILAARELGLRIPDEVELAAYFDGGVSAIADMPPIIMVVQKQNEIGRAAANLVISRIERTGPDTPQTIKTKPDVVYGLPQPLRVSR